MCNRIVLAWSGAKRSGTCSGISTHAAKRGHHCQTHRLSNRWLHRLHTAVELLVPRLVVDQDVASRLQLVLIKGVDHRPSLLSSEQLPRQPVAQPSERPAAPPAPQRWLGASLARLAPQPGAQQQRRALGTHLAPPRPRTHPYQTFSRLVSRSA